MQFLHCDVTREADLQAAADWLQQAWGVVRGCRVFTPLFRRQGAARRGASTGV